MKVLERHFAKMGARVKIEEHESTRKRRDWKSRRIVIDQLSPRVVLNVREDKKGEFFTLDITGDPKLQVVDVQSDDRHLLLHVDDGERKSKFLCGHDERHWFVAAVPESAGARDVRSAKIALQPPEVREVTTGVRHALKRKNEAYVRQGEWFFVPVPEFEPDGPVLRNEPLLRGPGNKAHIMEFCYRTGGIVSYILRGRDGEQTLTAAQWQRLPQSERRGLHSVQHVVRDPEVYVKGRVSHSDHATVTLQGWHRVYMNTERGSFAMRHVMFLD